MELLKKMPKKFSLSGKNSKVSQSIYLFGAMMNRNCLTNKET